MLLECSSWEKKLGGKRQTASPLLIKKEEGLEPGCPGLLAESELH